MCCPRYNFESGAEGITDTRKLHVSMGCDLPTTWKAYVLFPNAMVTGPPSPGEKEIGHVEPTVTGAVKVVLLNVMACATAAPAKAPKRMRD